jgi:uncharacterized protein YhaN
MILRGWHIDGFGVFHNERVDDLRSGVTVIHGPNEAGKSTLLAFIRGVLFGFPDKRSRKTTPLYEPVHGGTPGGRLFVENAGHSYTIARRAGGRHAASITDDNGATVPEGDLTQLLGGADAALFRNVFGFSLYELQELDTLTEESVRDRIFSGAIAGAGRSARQGANELRKLAGDLYKPDGRARSNRAAHLLSEISNIDKQLGEAKAAAKAYPEKVEAEREAAVEVERIRKEIDDLRTRKGELEALLRLWPEWCDRERALDELEAISTEKPDRFARIEADAALQALSQRAEELQRTAELQRERLERAGGLDGDLKQAASELNAALENLGEGWTEARVADFRMAIPTREEVRAWETAIKECETAAQRAADKLDEAKRHQVSTAEAKDRLERDLEALGTAPDDAETLLKRQSALEQLRVKVGELERRREAVSHAKSLAAERSKRVADLRRQLPGRGGLALALGVTALGLALGAGLAVMVGEIAGAATAGAALVAAALIALYARNRRRRGVDSISDAERDEKEAQDAVREAESAVERLADEIGEAAGGLFLSPSPDEAELVQALGHVRQDLDRRGRYDAKARELRDALQAFEEREADLKAANEDKEKADTALAEKLEAWRQWKAGNGFPEHLTAQGILDFAGQIEAARKALATKHDLAGKRERVRQDIDGWEREARHVLEVRAADSEQHGEDLVLAFGREAKSIQREMELYQAVRSVEATLSREGGNDAERIAKLRQTLASGESDSWTRECEDIEERLHTEEERRDDALRKHEAASNERKAVETSDRVAELETRRNALTAEVADVYRDWQVYTAGRELLEETLAAYERERQPAVFARAGQILDRVTGGRYRRIVQDESGEGFYVIDGREQRVSPIDLSRGTREQLYLAVRLGLVDEFGRRGTSLPLVMDEILVNFDPDRMATVARELGSYGADHQVLMFTCHPFVVDCVTSAVPDTRVVPVPGE